MSPRRLLTAATVTMVAFLVPITAPPASGQEGVESRVTDIERRTTTLVRRVESISGDVRVSESSEQVEVVLAADVLFEFDSALLTPGARSVLDEAAGRLEAEGEGESPVQVVGHTDSVGDDAYNVELSQRRAAAVRDALAALVPDLTYEAEGRGEAEPVAPNEDEEGGDNPEGRSRNRRVAITFAKAG